jgi:hypothetical protein
MAITPEQIVAFFRDGVLPSMKELILTLYGQPEVLWMVLPLFLSTVLIGLYFGRHKTEELGWNTAFGNTVSLLWVTTGLIRFLYEKHQTWDIFIHPAEELPIVIIVSLLGVWGLTLALCNYYHTIPKLVSFFISSSVPINITALLAIIIVVGEHPITKMLLIASFFMFIFIAIILAFLKAIWKPSKEAALYIEEYKKQAAKSKENREKAFHHHVIQLKRYCVAQSKATLITVKKFFGAKKK